jgi:hypothetical protein
MLRSIPTADMQCRPTISTVRSMNYRKAAAMCPVKFMPLYQLAKLYEASVDKNRAQELAKIMLNKRIKIPSALIQSIKNEMRRMMNEEKTDQSRQDNVSEQKYTPNYASYFLPKRTSRMQKK